MIPGSSQGPCTVIGTGHQLDPVTAAFNNGVLFRWLDYNDTWLAQEWGHPSDNYAAILSLAEYLSSSQNEGHNNSLTVSDVLDTATVAYEIQGQLANNNSLNQNGYDHVVFVRIASAAASALLQGKSLGLSPNSLEQYVINTTSHAFIDGCPLRCYRHTPNTGSRKSWAAGDASSRGLWLSFLTRPKNNSFGNQPGYKSPIAAPTWGFNDVFMKKPIEFDPSIPLGEYIMSNILFKVKFAAEFHSQTACEAAITLHQQYAPQNSTVDDADWINTISKIHVDTHEAAIRIISKPPTQNTVVTPDPLHNFADRDHCLQYIIAISLLNGSLTPDMYLDDYHLNHPAIDLLRSKMILRENPQFTQDYFDPSKRSIANSITLEFEDGTKSDTVVVEYPIGHRKRREEAYPLLDAKFLTNMAHRFSEETANNIDTIFESDGIYSTPIDQLLSKFRK